MANKINLFHKNEIGKTLEFNNLEPNKYNVKVSKLPNNSISVSNDGLHVDLSEIKSIIETLQAELDKEIGVAKAFPTQSIPDGYLPMEGQKFDTDRYPKLAKIYPSGTLPDLRGEFLRGWDNGRGLDPDRSLLTTQEDAIRNITGLIEDIVYQDVRFSDNANGVFLRLKDRKDKATLARNTANNKDAKGSDFAGGWELDHSDGISFDASRVVPTAKENRPHNIAFRFACRVG